MIDPKLVIVTKGDADLAPIIDRLKSLGEDARGLDRMATEGRYNYDLREIQRRLALL